MYAECINNWEHYYMHRVSYIIVLCSALLSGRLTALNKGSIWPQYMGHDIWDTLYNIYIYTINRCYCGLHQIVLSLLFVNKAKSYNHIQLHVGISGPLRITFDKVSINHFSLKTIFRKWYKSRYNSFIEKFTWYLVILHF